MSRLAEFAAIGASAVTIIVGAVRLAAYKAEHPGERISDLLSGFIRPDPKRPTDSQRKDS